VHEEELVTDENVEYPTKPVKFKIDFSKDVKDSDEDVHLTSPYNIKIFQVTNDQYSEGGIQYNTEHEDIILKYSNGFPHQSILTNYYSSNEPFEYIEDENGNKEINPKYSADNFKVTAAIKTSPSEMQGQVTGNVPYDIGRPIGTSYVATPNEKGELSIDIDFLEPGKYILEVENSGLKKYVEVIAQKDLELKVTDNVVMRNNQNCNIDNECSNKIVMNGDRVRFKYELKNTTDKIIWLHLENINIQLDQQWYKYLENPKITDIFEIKTEDKQNTEEYLQSFYDFNVTSSDGTTYCSDTPGSSTKCNAKFSVLDDNTIRINLESIPKLEPGVNDIFEFNLKLKDNIDSEKYNQINLIHKLPIDYQDDKGKQIESILETPWSRNIINIPEPKIEVESIEKSSKLPEEYREKYKNQLMPGDKVNYKVTLNNSAEYDHPYDLAVFLPKKYVKVTDFSNNTIGKELENYTYNYFKDNKQESVFDQHALVWTLPKLTKGEKTFTFTLEVDENLPFTDNDMYRNKPFDITKSITQIQIIPAIYFFADEEDINPNRLEEYKQGTTNKLDIWNVLVGNITGPYGHEVPGVNIALATTQNDQNKSQANDRIGNDVIVAGQDMHDDLKISNKKVILSEEDGNYRIPFNRANLTFEDIPVEVEGITKPILKFLVYFKNPLDNIVFADGTEKQLLKQFYVGSNGNLLYWKTVPLSLEKVYNVAGPIYPGYIVQNIEIYNKDKSWKSDPKPEYPSFENSRSVYNETALSAENWYWIYKAYNQLGQLTDQINFNEYLIIKYKNMEDYILGSYSIVDKMIVLNTHSCFDNNNLLINYKPYNLIHEFSHFIHFAIFNFNSNDYERNHGGYGNSNSSDSYFEGFASFMPRYFINLINKNSNFDLNYYRPNGQKSIIKSYNKFMSGFFNINNVNNELEGENYHKSLVLPYEDYSFANFLVALLIGTNNDTYYNTDPKLVHLDPRGKQEFKIGPIIMNSIEDINANIKILFDVMQMPYEGIVWNDDNNRLEFGNIKTQNITQIYNYLKQYPQFQGDINEIGLNKIEQLAILFGIFVDYHENWMFDYVVGDPDNHDPIGQPANSAGFLYSNSKNGSTKWINPRIDRQEIIVSNTAVNISSLGDRVIQQKNEDLGIMRISNNYLLGVFNNITGEIEVNNGEPEIQDLEFLNGSTIYLPEYLGDNYSYFIIPENSSEYKIINYKDYQDIVLGKAQFSYIADYNFNTLSDQDRSLGLQPTTLSRAIETEKQKQIEEDTVREQYLSEHPELQNIENEKNTFQEEFNKCQDMVNKDMQEFSDKVANGENKEVLETSSWWIEKLSQERNCFNPLYQQQLSLAVNADHIEQQILNNTFDQLTTDPIQELPDRCQELLSITDFSEFFLSTINSIYANPNIPEDQKQAEIDKARIDIDNEIINCSTPDFVSDDMDQTPSEPFYEPVIDFIEDNIFSPIADFFDSSDQIDDVVQSQQQRCQQLLSITDFSEFFLPTINQIRRDFPEDMQEAEIEKARNDIDIEILECAKQNIENIEPEPLINEAMQESRDQVQQDEYKQQLDQLNITESMDDICQKLTTDFSSVALEEIFNNTDFQNSIKDLPDEEKQAKIDEALDALHAEEAECYADAQSASAKYSDSQLSKAASIIQDLLDIQNNFESQIDQMDKDFITNNANLITSCYNMPDISYLQGGFNFPDINDETGEPEDETYLISCPELRQKAIDHEKKLDNYESSEQARYIDLSNTLQRIIDGEDPAYFGNITASIELARDYLYDIFKIDNLINWINNLDDDDDMDGEFEGDFGEFDYQNNINEFGIIYDNLDSNFIPEPSSPPQLSDDRYIDYSTMTLTDEQKQTLDEVKSKINNFYLARSEEERNNIKNDLESNYWNFIQQNNMLFQEVKDPSYPLSKYIKDRYFNIMSWDRPYEGPSPRNLTDEERLMFVDAEILINLKQNNIPLTDEQNTRFNQIKDYLTPLDGELRGILEVDYGILDATVYGSNLQSPFSPQPFFEPVVEFFHDHVFEPIIHFFDPIFEFFNPDFTTMTFTDEQKQTLDEVKSKINNFYLASSEEERNNIKNDLESNYLNFMNENNMFLQDIKDPSYPLSKYIKDRYFNIKFWDRPYEGPSPRNLTDEERLMFVDAENIINLKQNQVELTSQQKERMIQIQEHILPISNDLRSILEVDYGILDAITSYNNQQSSNYQQNKLTIQQVSNPAIKQLITKSINQICHSELVEESQFNSDPSISFHSTQDDENSILDVILNKVKNLSIGFVKNLNPFSISKAKAQDETKNISQMYITKENVDPKEENAITKLIAGQTVVLNAKNFTNSKNIQIYLDDKFLEDAKILGGGFGIKLRIPPNTKAGNHTIKLIGDSQGEYVFKEVTIKHPTNYNNYLYYALAILFALALGYVLYKNKKKGQEQMV